MAKMAAGTIDSVNVYVPSFAQWMLFGVPLVVVLLFVAWVVLLKLFKPQSEELNLKFDGRWMKTGKAWVVYVTSLATILLWLLGKPLFGLSSSVVALIPVVIFCVTGVMTAKDVRSLSWDVLWLIAGGFALGGAMKETGLSENIVVSTFGSLAPLLLMIVAAGVTTLMATFMSNTATANLLIPLMAAMGVGLSGLDGIGGPMGLIIAVTMAASLGMSPPISTPPNAMAHATGMIESKHLTQNGVVIGIIGLTIMIIFVIFGAMIGLI